MEGFMCMRVQQDIHMSMYKSNNSSSYILSGTVPKVRNSYEILATHFHLLYTCAFISCFTLNYYSENPEESFHYYYDHVNNKQ